MSMSKYTTMINRNDSVRNSTKNFKLPPIQGAIPTADILRKPPAARRNQATRLPKQSKQRNLTQGSRETAFVVPNPLKPIGQQQHYRNTTPRAPGYAAIRTAGTPRKLLIERDFPNPRLVPAQPCCPPNSLRSYAVLPPIKPEIGTANEKAPANPPHTEKGARSTGSLIDAPNTSEKKEIKKAKTKQNSENPEKEKVQVLAGERKTSATLRLFCEGSRKDRRVGVCPENEPTLINITEQLKEIFLRRNMEEMYLI